MRSAAANNAAGEGDASGLGRVQKGGLLVDVRCLLPGGGAALVRRLCEAAHATGADIEGI